MTALIVVALGAVACVLAAVGVRLLRADVLDTLPIEDLPLLRKNARRRGREGDPLTRLARSLQPAVRRHLGVSLVARLQRMVDEAGRPDGMSVADVLVKLTWWGLIGGFLAFLYAIQGKIVIGLLLIPALMMIPLLQLSTRRQRRRARIDRDLPDFLDVLAVTVMAGVGFRQALARVCAYFPGPLKEEVELSVQQVTNGASIRESFTDMSRRTASAAMAQFVSALLQSQELGAPLAESLGSIADDMRRASAQRQRQDAARKSPQVAFISSAVLLPGVLAIVGVGLYLASGVNLGDLMGGLSGQ